ncbi:hypothetical protein J6590_029760 [Homalodisca vitripennis]|nr:hypothetical protein J6590_029760 [Homalodisca vitripennis]
MIVAVVNRYQLGDNGVPKASERRKGDVAAIRAVGTHPFAFTCTHSLTQDPSSLTTHHRILSIIQ